MIANILTLGPFEKKGLPAGDIWSEDWIFVIPVAAAGEDNGLG